MAGDAPQALSIRPPPLERGVDGKDGEVLHKFDVPEAVTPLEETIGRERSKSAFELFVEYIIGTNDESQ